MLNKKILILLLINILLLLKILNVKSKKIIIKIERQKAKNFFIKNLTNNILKDIWKGQNNLNEICSALHGRDKVPTMAEIEGDIDINEENKCKENKNVYLNFMQMTKTHINIKDLEMKKMKYEGSGIKEIDELFSKIKLDIPTIKEKKGRIWRAKCAFDMFLLRVIVELYLSLSESEIEILRVYNDEQINYKIGGEKIINGINKWFNDFGEINKKGYKLFENNIKDNINIVIYNEQAKHRSCSFKLFVFRALLALAQIINQLPRIHKANYEKQDEINNAIIKVDKLISKKIRGKTNYQKIYKVYHEILIPNLEKYLKVEVDYKRKSVRLEGNNRMIRTYREETDMKMKNALEDFEDFEEEYEEDGYDEDENNNYDEEEIENVEDEENKNKKNWGGENSEGENKYKNSENSSNYVYEVYRQPEKSSSGRSIETIMLNKNEEKEVNSHVNKKE
uniref:Uncharacterized protein n=1 Tax=Meloidogyne hapla TaxID=6305 RepID=A0A1I8BE54_MELHA